MASMDLWDIVDGYDKPPPFYVDPKVLKEHQRCIKKAMSIISLNLADNELMYIKIYKGPAEEGKTLCNIY